MFDNPGILVTGGAGYLGSCVIKAFSGVKARVIVLDDLLYAPRYFPATNVEFVRGRVEDFNLLGALCQEKQVVAVIWLAAIVGDAPCMVDPSLSLRVNTEAVRWLAKFDGRVVFPSTCSVYGRQENPASEVDLVNPLSIYAMTKVMTEACLDGHPQAWVFRLGTLHGVSDRMRFDLMVNSMTRDAVETGVVRVFGGQQNRPLVHVRDVARLMAQVALGSSIIPPDLYNVASENLTALEVGTIVANVCGVRLQVEEVPYEDRRDYSVSSAKLEATEGWPFRDATSVRDSCAEMEKLLLSGELRDSRESSYYNVRALEQGNYEKSAK